jgi:hypothetical protein
VLHAEECSVSFHTRPSNMLQSRQLPLRHSTSPTSLLYRTSVVPGLQRQYWYRSRKDSTTIDLKSVLSFRKAVLILSRRIHALSVVHSLHLANFRVYSLRSVAIDRLTYNIPIRRCFIEQCPRRSTSENRADTAATDTTNQIQIASRSLGLRISRRFLPYPPTLKKCR